MVLYVPLLHQLSLLCTVTVLCATTVTADGAISELTPAINELIYEDVENGCFCRIDPQLLTSCYGQDCEKLPKNVYIYNRRLRVSGTAIQSLSEGDFIGYEDLLELQMDGNEISSISAGTFINLPNLVNLSISFNGLKYIGEDAFIGLPSLRRLRLMKNQFSSLLDITPSLTRLPALKELVLSENALGRINSDDFALLTNSSIQVLELANCALSYIQPDSLLPLKELKRLKLSENTMPNDNLVYIVFLMRYTQLQILDLSHLFARTPPRDLLDVLSESNVTELSLQRNTIPHVKANTFPLIPMLRTLDLSDCGIIEIDNGSFAQLPGLRKLNLASNTLVDIPAALMLPQLEHLSLKDNSGGSTGDLEVVDGDFRDMSNLTFLELSYNRIGQLSQGVFIGLSKLEQLELINTSLYRLIEGCFKPLVSLKTLLLAGNYLARQTLSAALFQGLEQLHYLNLDNCRLSSFSEAGIFRYCPRLARLSMRGNLIQTFHVNPFADTASLRYIDLTDNQIRSWKKPLLHSSPNMERLVMTNNHISTVTEAMLKDVAPLVEVSLLSNPLDCDCQLLPIKTHVVANETKLSIKVDLCSSPDEWRFSPVTKFLTHLNHRCQKDSDQLSEYDINPWLIAVFVLVALLLLAVTMTLAAYKSRWFIRYYLFRKQLKQSGLREIEVETGDFQYDAFISYSNEDQAFVVELIDNLENQSPHYKLCIYERDFTAGTVINECIMQSIANSRKVVMIISQNFISSQWCLWELHLAQHSLLEEKREGIILIVVEKVKHSDLPPTLRFLMKTRIYLEWESEPTKQDIFWTRLRSALMSSKKSTQERTHFLTSSSDETI